MHDLVIAGSGFDCVAPSDAASVPIHAIRPVGLAGFLDTLPERTAAFLRHTGFSGKAGQVALIPGGDGISGALVGLGDDGDPLAFGALPFALPEGMVCRLDGQLEAPDQAALGFMLGAYRFDQLKSAPGRAPCRLVLPAVPGRSESIARTTWLVRDLINLPANLLGPAELAEVARAELVALGAEVQVVTGAALADAYPLVAAVGAGAARPPSVVVARFQSADAEPDSPLISLCGKGVCFDTGGYDLKPGASMLRMKKDMAGAAIVLGLAKLLITHMSKLRLELRLGCVENSVSGSAMRPLDVVRSRRGLTVAVGNTDAEGRLVLADLLAEASEARPDLLLDFATLTGAARTALGPDIIAMFCNDDAVAHQIETAARMAHDPVWRLPLWNGYNSLLETHGCDLNNVSDKPYAGAIIAALFLQRFVGAGTRWAHFDLYAWNDVTRPGRPEGGEAQGLRAAFCLISRFIHLSNDRA